MAQARKVKGKNFLIFVGGKALALTTDTTLTLSAETADASSKDDGIWQKQDVGSMSWQAQNTSFYSVEEDRTADVVGAQLMQTMLAGEPVDITVGVPTNASNDEVPEEGWTAPTTAFGTYKGKGIITELEIQGTNGEMATCSMTVQGYGQLTPQAPSE